MAEKQTLGSCLSAVPDTISPSFLPEPVSQRGQERGLNYFVQSFIHEIKVESDNASVLCSSKCWRSLRKNEEPHRQNIKILIGGSTLSDAFCSCKAGQSGHCAHIVGLLKTLQGLKLHNFSHVPELQSCTSVPQQWHMPRGEKILPVPLSQVVVARPLEQRKRRPVICQISSDNKLPKLCETDITPLQTLKGTPLQYMMKEDAPTVTTPIGEVQLGSILSYQTTRTTLTEPPASTGCSVLEFPKKPPINLPLEFQALNKEYAVNSRAVESETRLQADCQKWHTLRATRITASNFGKILHRKKAPNTSFLDSLFPVSKIRATSLDYGKRNEHVAKAKYLSTFRSVHMHTCGLLINNEFSFLGATPDAVLCSAEAAGIVEIKCPYSARNYTVLDAAANVPGFCIKTDENGNLKLDRKHVHYCQIQGQLLISGAEFCEFVVFTKKDLHVERIYPDKPFMCDMLKTLSEFFRDVVIPFLETRKSV